MGASEKTMIQRFNTLGYQDRFVFLGRIGEGRAVDKYRVRCKRCGTQFEAWKDTLNGRIKRVICPECGAASDGKDVFAKTAKAKEALEYYRQGHSVKETAELYGTTKTQINNIVKVAGATNGKDFVAEGRHHNESVRKKTGSKRQIGGNIYARAKRHGANVVEWVTLKACYEKYDGICCICGKHCDWDDRRYGRTGPDYPNRGHIVASSLGGEVSWKNIWLVCQECNVKFGAEDESSLLRKGGWTWDPKQKKYVRESIHSESKR